MTKLAAVLVSWLCLPGVLWAQVGIGADVVIPSRYVWRGITRSESILLQPSAYLVGGGDRGSLRAGIWTSFELSPMGPRHLSDLGAGETGLAEANYWIHFQREQGNTSLAAGLTWYRFEGTVPTAGRTRDWNTMEVYGSAHFRKVFLAPRIEVWYDTDRIDGAYIEGSVGLPVLGNIEGDPPWAIHLTETMGISAGQEVNGGAPDELGYFEDSGPTHLLTTLSTTYEWRRLWPGQLVATGNLQLNFDDATKPVSRTRTRDLKCWLSLAVILSVWPNRNPYR